MADAITGESESAPTPRRAPKFTTGVLVANAIFLGVGALILLVAGQRLFGHLLGLPDAAGFLWLLLGVCAAALAVLSAAAARAGDVRLCLTAVVTLLVFQVGSALVSFVVGLTTNPTVFANFAPHLVLAVLLGLAWWRLAATTGRRPSAGSALA